MRYDGRERKTTDWADHGTPHLHHNLHDYYSNENPTGGTPQRVKAPYYGSLK